MRRLIGLMLGGSLLACSGTATELPPPWGDLGLRYGTATVASVDPGVVLLTAAPTDVAALDTLYADWQKALEAQGYTLAGGGWKVGDDAADPYVKGDQRVSIAHGVVRDVAYLYAEDLQKIDPSAVATQAVDGAVLKLLPGDAPTAVADPPSGTKGSGGPARGKLRPGSGDLESKAKGKGPGKGKHKPRGE